jgi:hypothetical protein
MNICHLFTFFVVSVLFHSLFGSITATVPSGVSGSCLFFLFFFILENQKR